MPGKKASKVERERAKKAAKQAAKGLGVNAYSWFRTGTGWVKHKPGAAVQGDRLHAEIQALQSIGGQSVVWLDLDAFPCSKCDEKLKNMTKPLPAGHENKGEKMPSIIVACSSSRYKEDHAIPPAYQLQAQNASEDSPCRIYYHRGAKSFDQPATFPSYS